jgi:hypothetical protein
MSSTSPEEQPQIVHFAIVVEGEVAWFHGIDERLERAVAAFRSEPVIVEITEEQRNTIGFDWTYDGKSFVEPK